MNRKERKPTSRNWIWLVHQKNDFYCSLNGDKSNCCLPITIQSWFEIGDRIEWLHLKGVLSRGLCFSEIAQPIDWNKYISEGYSMWGSLVAFWVYKNNQIIFQTSLVSRHVKRLYQMLSLSVSVIQMRVHLCFGKLLDQISKALDKSFSFAFKF